MTSSGHPPLFIGSSVEALDVAYALQEGLDFDAEPTVWSQGIFSPTKDALSSLVSALPKFAFSVFVFSPDDVSKLRGVEYRVARDNVVFEFGLFVGRLGPNRCFYLLPRGIQDFHLPTDLLGAAALTYRTDRSDGNLVAALGPACNQIRRAMRSVNGIESKNPADESKAIRSYETAWKTPELLEARAILRSGLTDHFDPNWPRQRKAMQRVFALLESLSDGVLSGAVNEAEASEIFRSAVLAFWPSAATMLAPANHVDDWWIPPPKLAELYWKWKSEEPVVEK